MTLHILTLLTLLTLTTTTLAITSSTYITNSLDDIDNNAVSDTDLDIGHGDVGMLFRTTGMTRGDKISLAWLYVYAEESWVALTTDTVGNMRGLVPPLGGYPNFETSPLAGRATTSASILYEFDATVDVGGSDIEFSLLPLVQEVVNSFWFNGDVGLILYDATSGPNRAIASVDDGAVSAPRLYVSYVEACRPYTMIYALANGVASPSINVPIGDPVTLSCNGGYSLSGSTTRTCTASRTYDGSSTSCSLITNYCPSLPLVNAVTTGGTCFRSVGSSCTATCSPGYVYLSGSTSRVCGSSASWSGSTYTCTNSVCPSLPLPNGDVTYSAPSRIYGSSATLACNTGYSLSGSISRVCSQDLGGGVASWSGPGGQTCDILDCGTLTQLAPSNGDRVCTGTTFGETCTFSCDPGFQLFGTAVRTCGPAGTWTGAADTLCSTVNATQSGVSAPPSLTRVAGQGWDFTVQTRDSNGLVVSAGSDVVALHLAGDNGASPPLAVGSYSGSNGEYAVSYPLPPVTGVTVYEIRINSDLVAPFAHQVTVLAGPGSAPASSASGALETSTVGVESSVLLDIRDAHGNARDGSGTPDELEASMQTGATPVPLSVIQVDDHTYSVVYTPPAGGIYTLSLSVNGDPLPGSPWAVIVDSACQPGFRAIDQTSCAECPVSTYSTQVNAQACIECDATRVSPPQSSGTFNCTCRPGFWSGIPGGGADPGINPCLSCPAGGLCVGGPVAPIARPGYQGTDTSGVFIECPVADACLGSDLCQTGYRGRLCADCAEGFYKINEKCFKCSKGNAAVMPIMLMAAFGLSCLLVWLNTRESALYGWAAFIISMNSAQIVAIYADLSLGWNDLASNIFRVFSVLNFNLDLASPECSVKVGNVWVAKYIMTMLLPLLFALLFALVYVLVLVYASFVRATADAWVAAHPDAHAPSNSWIQRRYARLRSETHITPAYLQAACARAYLQLLGLFYLPLCAMTLKWYDCQLVETGVYVFTAAPAHRCYTGTYYSVLPVAIIFTLLYALGIPVLVATLLRFKKKRLPWVQLQIRYGFLVARFRDGHYAFEVFIMVRKLVIVLAIVSFSRPLTKASAASLALLIAGFHVTFVAPYRKTLHNGLETVSIACSCVILSAQTISHDNTFRDVVVIIFLLSLVAVLIAGTCLDAVLLLREEKEALEDTQFADTKLATMDGVSNSDFTVHTVYNDAGHVELDPLASDGYDDSTAGIHSVAPMSIASLDQGRDGDSTIMSSATPPSSIPGNTTTFTGDLGSVDALPPPPPVVPYNPVFAAASSAAS